MLVNKSFNLFFGIYRGNYQQIIISFTDTVCSKIFGSTGNVSQETVEEYLEHHRNPSNKDMGNMILE